MTINPYTLNCLVQKGILDYVPMELMTPTPIAGMGNMQNPYMNMAMSGNLYQQAGMDRDMFIYGNSGLGPNNAKIGSLAANNLGKMFGFSGIGSKSKAGANMFGQVGIGDSSTIGWEDRFGGFQDAKNSVSGTWNTFSNFPPLLKGLIAAPIFLLTIASCFRFKKKPKVKKGSMLNPLNWFRKPKPQPQPVKKSFWSRLTGKK